MIIFPKLKKLVHHGAFRTKMLGLPKYNGDFDFNKKRLDIPTIFPMKRSSIDLRNISAAPLLEKIDNNNIIYSTDRCSFHVAGKDIYDFRVPEICTELIAGNGKAYILTKKHMYIYKEKRIRVFKFEAIDLSTSPFNEVFVLTHDKILIFGENGLKETFPYQGEVRFIHFYLFRELILTDNNQIFHLNLNKLKVSVIYVTNTKITSTIFRDKLYIMETSRFTSLNIEERSGESICVGKPMRVAIGDTMLALYSLNGEFLFCDRLDITINEGVIYDVVGLLGFFFVGSRGYFLFRDRLVMWNLGTVKVVDLCKKEIEDYIASFPDTLDILEEDYKNRKSSIAAFKPNGIHEKLTKIIKGLFKKEESMPTSSIVKKKTKYADNRRGGF